MLKRNTGQNIVTYCLGVCEQENRIFLIGKVMVTLTEIEIQEQKQALLTVSVWTQ